VSNWQQRQRHHKHDRGPSKRELALKLEAAQEVIDEQYRVIAEQDRLLGEANVELARLRTKSP